MYFFTCMPLTLLTNSCLKYKSFENDNEICVSILKLKSYLYIDGKRQPH